MSRWEQSLPGSIQMLIDVEDSDLGDFAGSVRRQEVLARLAYKRALEGAGSQAYAKSEIVEMGDKRDVPPKEQTDFVSEDDVNRRLEIATKANMALATVKQQRLEAVEKHKDKASDTPKPANIVFVRVENSPTHLVRHHIKLGRIEDAKIVARDANLDWSEFEKFCTA